MKKLLLLSALFIFSCSNDEGNPCVYEPTLTTQAATDITETSATLNGVISIVSENCEVPNNTEQGFVYSTEIQQAHSLQMTEGALFKKSFYGTVSYMPALFGLLGAAEVISFISKIKNTIKKTFPFCNFTPFIPFYVLREIIIKHTTSF